MKLSTRNGALRLRSAFKLMFFGWLISWGLLFGLILIILFIVALAGGTVDVNGEPRQGLDAVVGMLPFFPMVALILPFHAAMFSGLICFGLFIYRLFKPIRVEAALVGAAESNDPTHR
ncbi:MAG: hypothetical protein RIA71_11910 [Oceanicaulis sp.]